MPLCNPKNLIVPSCLFQDCCSCSIRSFFYPNWMRRSYTMRRGSARRESHGRISNRLR
ncbi:Protein of unknown function [Pyronema omphalodes CBS 100304]|uniref:Uncharacterized protein n=1 Tax=Pyronema omphalodes (strain CBS 100304) TaxID=1076935 RepID=U4LEL8_PYROM|nr:Protein of unknown function [Pyronema omphalodes CBS 100304]